MNANGGDAFTRLKVGMLRRIQSRISKFHAFALVALTAGLPHQSVPAGEPEVTCGNESREPARARTGNTGHSSGSRSGIGRANMTSVIWMGLRKWRPPNHT